VRRQILKARSFSELRPRIQQGIRDFGPYLRGKLDNWAAEKDQLCRKVRPSEELESGSIPPEETCREHPGYTRAINARGGEAICHA
jgi:hypothetical protein